MPCTCFVPGTTKVPVSASAAGFETSTMRRMPLPVWVSPPVAVVEPTSSVEASGCTTPNMLKLLPLANRGGCDMLPLVLNSTSSNTRFPGFEVLNENTSPYWPKMSPVPASKRTRLVVAKTRPGSTTASDRNW